MPGITVTPVIREFAQSPPEADISIVHTSPSNQASYLLEGKVDVCFVQLPISPRLFDIVPLQPQPHVVVLPADHPLAAAADLSLEHLSGLNRVGLGEQPDPVGADGCGPVAGLEKVHLVVAQHNERPMSEFYRFAGIAQRRFA